MLDRAFRVVLRDYTTYVLIAAVLLVPLHVVHSYIFQDTIAVSALHSEIAELSSDDSVRGVGASDLTTYRLTGGIVLLIEILLLPVLAMASGVALDQRERGELPSVRTAWKGAVASAREHERRRSFSGVLIAAALVALLVGLMARAAGLLLLEPLSDRTLWAGVGLVEGLARSLAVPFVTVPTALLWRHG